MASEPDSSSEVGSSLNMTSWIRELLELKNEKGQRIMSPLTESRARQILAGFKGVGDGADTSDNPWAKASLATLPAIKVEMTGRMEADAQYAECRIKLEQLAHDGFYLRYSDYYAITLNQLRTEVTKVIKEAEKIAKKNRKKRSPLSEAGEMELEEKESTEANTMAFFLNEPWDTIDERLNEEERPPAGPIYLKDLISQLAKAANLPGLRFVRSAIKLYAKRNDVAHKNLGDLAKSGHFHKLANTIEADLRTLSTFNTWGKQRAVSKGHLETTKQAVFKTAELYFKVFDYDEATSQLLDSVSWPVNPDGTINRSMAEEESQDEPEKANEEELSSALTHLFD
ncbi:hypothetical protein F4820DRAFT_449308 [Hypoxylon rubiginosum]|uniref:Uncharacterized protein n=1 Tax=Hypoxylon rubiginosum TaxID=110542 RepID=A0ACB9YYQ7_9PEZI|nr:hypothetical protein F4820DRAFT_449308 [Hypoxylon rubiginosum]